MARHPGVQAGSAVLGLLVLMALFAPHLNTIDPAAIDPDHVGTAIGQRAVFTDLSGNSVERLFYFGTDGMGRDVYSRVLYGARVSLVVGTCVAVTGVLLGGLLGLFAGYVRRLDGVLMRIMDGLMAVPSILLAIALVSLWEVSLATLVIAIALPDLPRVARVVRATVLSVRTAAFVEAARMMSVPAWKIMLRHILPAAVAPLAIQGTFIFGSAILVEAVLSFLGVGFSSDVPTWGNVMADGRVNFNLAPHLVLIPGCFLALTIVAVNMLGDGLRDVLDPKYAPRDTSR
ncbi:ABC transporter permease [Stenotrophomonas sp. CPCC 101365]|uniref:ABC transporter permease n=2 Tax=Stenotrophomonas mori TaxID=2871096 RepID=A0ABT0SHM0_9GAMM|nr:ABC transporter permease [Stenotrophomonas mori]MCL7714833.1 ABC transporter permease [Stenotrophomonas mori]